MKHPIKTTCPYCGVGCGVDLTVHSETSVDVQGDKTHPANFGRLCVKGSALGDTIGFEDRLLYPQIDGQRVNWSQAIQTIAERFKQSIAQYGPDSVALYVSGQLLTEDYYVANKLAKGFLGTGNIDTNSRLCMSSAVAGYKRAFGSDTVPNNYEDLEQADLIVLVGSNTAWCHPVVYQRMIAAQQARTDQPLKLVVVDPRATRTSDTAQLHLAIKPGTDTVLFNGLLAYLVKHNKVDQAFVDQHTDGFEAALQAAADYTVGVVAMQCDVDQAQVEQFYDWVATTEKTVTFFSMGVNQSSSGTDKVNSIINVHLATGRIGRPGMGPFSMTGQPNAMGGREVGGLSNQLAAHMDIQKAEHRDCVSRFWQAPELTQTAGLMAVDLFEAAAAGKIKVLWIMATNPMVSLPNADLVKKAMQQCDTVIVSDCIETTNTAQYADILLPAAGWGEKDGTVTNSERRISRQRPFRAMPAEVKADWWIMTQVAQALGWRDQFGYQQPVDIFREHARLSAFENQGQRDFDLTGFSHITHEQYEHLQPIQWPVKTDPFKPDYKAESERMFIDQRFFTDNGRAQFQVIQPRLPVNNTDASCPLVLNTGRLRDQWHTMTRTGLSAKLNGHIREPFLAVHPDDAATYQIKNLDLVWLTSRWGKALARAQITRDQRRGEVFMPMHWNDQFARHARVDAVVNPVVDPVSGEPEFKHTPVMVEKAAMAWQAFVITQSTFNVPDEAVYAVRRKAHDCTVWELAGSTPVNQDLQHWLAPDAACDTIHYQDQAAGHARLAVIDQQRLTSVAFITQKGSLPDRAWLTQLFGQTLSPIERRSLLAGRPMDPAMDVGPIVCSCFGVGQNTINQAIVEGQLTTPACIGKKLKAGTNCGSCIPELKNLITQSAISQAS